MGSRVVLFVVIGLLIALGCWFLDPVEAWRRSQEQQAKNERMLAENSIGKDLADDHPGEAIARFRRAIELVPSYSESHYNTAVTLAKMGREAEAIECYREAVRLRPSLHKAHLNLGNCLARAGRIPEAIEHFNRVVEFDKRNAQAHFNRAKALNSLGRRSDAIDSAKRAAEAARRDKKTAKLAEQIEAWIAAQKP